MRHESIRLGKKYKRLRKHELLILNDSTASDSIDDKNELLDKIASQHDTFAEAADSLFTQEAFTLLTPAQQIVIQLTVLEGATEQEAAAELGVSKQAVNKMKKRALKRLENCLNVHLSCNV